MRTAGPNCHSKWTSHEHKMFPPSSKHSTVHLYGKSNPTLFLCIFLFLRSQNKWGLKQCCGYVKDRRIRIREAQKHTDPKGYQDPQQWLKNLTVVYHDMLV
jgi:hypothetical protein